jgi:NAD(P)H-hydrate repair Nnr-like enzyme with NAD(P)H-hydrate dehydratase domain
MIKKITTENSNQTLEQRKQEALQTAAKCRQILLEKGAKEVILNHCSKNPTGDG